MPRSGKKIVVIGSGFGGLSAAIRLQARGYRVELLEARDKLGGRAYVYQQDGFTFDAGPTVITAPFLIDEIFAAAGRLTSDYVRIVPVDPFYRIEFHNGRWFEYNGDEAETERRVAEFAPRDLTGYREMILRAKAIFEKGFLELSDRPFLKFSDMLRIAPDLVRLQSYRTVYGFASKYVKDPLLQRVFSFHPLLVGGNPFQTTSIYALIHYLERQWGVHYVMGGTGALVAALGKLFCELGGSVKLSTPVRRILTADGQATGVETARGEIVPADAVLSNADIANTYRLMLAPKIRRKNTDQHLERMRYSMSLFVIYFGTSRQYPEIRHHTIILSERYRGLLNDIFNTKLLPADFSLYLHRPSATDPQIAPPGCDCFYALIPAPNQASRIDWNIQREPFRDRIMKFLEERYLPELGRHLVTERIFTPLDFETTLNSYLGAAFSFEPIFRQSAWFRPHNQSEDIPNLFFTGAGTHPGAGVPRCVVVGEDRGETDLRAAAELDLAALYSQAAEATARGSKSFYFATRFFPRDMARSAHAVYWFCRHTDDLVDECVTIEQGRQDLEQWAGQVRAALAGEPPEHPVLGPFMDTVRKYDIPHEYPLELIEGMRMDLMGTRYRTFGELRVFCYRVASVVGLMMSHVIGFRGNPQSYAIDLGIAMQLTNILRDVGEDLARGRVYLPGEEMERFGYSERKLKAGVRDESFRELMRFQAKRARSYYKAAEPGIAMLSKEGRFAVKIASDVYRDILSRIERSDYDVFEKRAVVPAAQKYWLTAKAIIPVYLNRRYPEQLPRVPLAVLAGLTVHYLCFYFAGTPLWTETIAEWIMAHTPSQFALPILTTLGAWAKPFAMTGALATLGFAASVGTLIYPWLGCLLAAVALGGAFHYESWIGQMSFWLPVALLLSRVTSSVRLQPDAGARQEPRPTRRAMVVGVAGVTGVVAVALESYARDWELGRRAITPVSLWPFQLPPDHFGEGLVRKAVTPIPEFYGMSKDAVDPVIDPRTWRLKITLDGRIMRQVSYADLLALPRIERYITLRCISNTLQSDLMGTAAWSGIRLEQIVSRKLLPAGIVEAAIIGVDGHGDSFTLEYAFSDEILLALGMNGKTLNRTHGFPLRLASPRYYGFKSVKWIAEIAFVSKPYYGTWPKLGYTKEPLIHTASHFDRVVQENGSIRAGGAAFAGIRGIREVRLRADQGPWLSAILDQPLSPYTWTRWYGSIPAGDAKHIEAQAMDGAGHWQETTEGPLFPDGVTGPTIRRLRE